MLIDELESGPKLSGTVRKAFQVMDALRGPRNDLTPRELALATGLDRTTVYRLLETLVQVGVVARDERTRRYHLGLRNLDYAAATLDGLEVRHVALSHLMDLERELILAPDDVERSLFIGVLDGADVVLVEVGWTRSVFAHAGGRTRFPAYASAAGRCILAHLAAHEREALLGQRELSARTPRTLISRADIDARMQEIRRDGYDVSDREVFADLLAVAVPVLGRSGNALASIGCCVAASSTTVDALVEQFADKLVRVAQRTAMALRYRD